MSPKEAAAAKILGVIIVVVLLFYFGKSILDQILEFLNVKDTKDEKKAVKVAKEINTTPGVDAATSKKLKDANEASKKVAQTDGQKKDIRKTVEKITINPFLGTEW